MGPSLAVGPKGPAAYRSRFVREGKASLLEVYGARTIVVRRRRSEHGAGEKNG